MDRVSVACSLPHLIHPTLGRFTHVMADEATQGIDPDGSEKSLEETHLIPLSQGVNSDTMTASGASFDKSVVEITPSRICLWHALWSDFWAIISDTRVKESGGTAEAHCESLLSSFRRIPACEHFSCKRQQPYPRACCLC